MNNEQKNFIEMIANACNLHRDYGILPSMTIAQAIKESNWGKSTLSAKYFNFFGMKWTKTCGCDYVEMSTKEWDKATQKYITVKAKFRKYKSVEDGIKGYYDFITGYKRYNNLIGEKDSKTACMNIAKDGWATSPTYGESLYNDYVVKYNLTEYDNTDITVKNKCVENKPQYDIYTVEKGDTLWGISKKFLGNGIYWRKIYDYNHMKNTLIYVGQQIAIPRK